MTSKFSEHTSANYFLHTGSGLQGRPSMGAWVSYGLGSENKNLPGFIVLNGGLIPPGGLDNFNSGFLPAAYQGSIFRSGRSAGRQHPPASRPATRNSARKLDLLRRLDAGVAARGRTRRCHRVGHRQLRDSLPHADRGARTDGHRTAKRAATQEHVRPRCQIRPTRIFGTECLIARRLIERGARFIELTCPTVGARSLGPARRLEAGPREQRPGRRSADRGAA